jgi:hypothetical protein
MLCLDQVAASVCLNQVTVSVCLNQVVGGSVGHHQRLDSNSTKSSSYRSA